ncbi:MAG: hypothetical protein ACE5RK_09085 [Candidatus Nitrosomaritimum aestuariumsis]
MSKKCLSLDLRKEAMTSQLHQSGQSQRLPTHTLNSKHEHKLMEMKEKTPNEYKVTLFDYVSKSPPIGVENLHDRRL